MKQPVTVVAIVLSTILVLASTCLPVMVDSQLELAEVKLGLPFPFIIQNQAYYPPFFPWKTRFTSIWEHLIQIHFHVFFIDIVIVCIKIIFLFKIFKVIAIKLR
ncbi:hypothetical protein [Gloeocapsopsis dulcis]|uniref:Uncharacterized protein n=1 Tax=Gloeocapsopsis dulcis AAB1 = 1H9 TaxID=1433147 RepID=A0A6N8FR16_9CHRO|nr:hypothetical protein [Gloeocapsopsis dulcis]MUL35600.1 hypothetical protein [Gloeocapsopsis dulcis AAB1 = 1H9]WNN87498.1 hypothetical protein P0S91_14300 [Gloeocapsopsis dulcis]